MRFLQLVYYIKSNDFHINFISFEFLHFRNFDKNVVNEINE